MPFSHAVVWDALTDAVLLQGWLAREAEPLPGDRLAVALDGVALPGASAGVLRSVASGSVATLDLGVAGEVRFLLEDLGPIDDEPAGGARRLTLCRAEGDPAHDLAAVGLAAALEARLTALEELLRGRPVEWAAVGASTGKVTER